MSSSSRTTSRRPILPSSISMVVDDNRNNHRYQSVKVDETMTLKYRTVHDDVFDDDELSLPRTISFNSSAAITIDTASCTSTTSSSTVTSSSNATSRSIATASTRSTVTASTRNSNKSKLSSIQRAKTISSCPVTGQLSNVLDDYIIFPTVLGNGQYGKVRDCIHRQSRKYYACKSIDKSKVGRLDHLQREIEVLSMIDHHGIIKLVDCY